MISLGIFFSFHLFITVKNYTTYEYITKVLKKNDNNPVETADESQMSMFNIGMYENFTQVFGSNPLYWFLPIKCGMILILILINRKKESVE